MTLPTAEQVTNMYLYGSTTRPGDLLDPSLLNHRDSNSQNQFYIDTFEYMATGPGRFVNSANFEVVTQFFSDTGLSPGTYTKYQLFAQFGITYGGYAVNQLYLGTDDLDYAERTYIWGTTKFKIADDALFIVNADGSREIQNFAIIPDGDENFDFNGGQVSNIGNAALQPVIDPSGIGRKVDLIFTQSTAVPRITVTEEVFSFHEETVITVNFIDTVSASTKGLYAIEDLKNILFSSGGQSIRFLDPENRPIIYGTNGDDSISGFITPSGVNLDQDEYNIDGWAGSVLDIGLDSNLYPYISNGITYITGDGNDFLTGTDYNDFFIGGNNDDTYIINNENDKILENLNEGIDTVLSKITYSLGENVEKLTLIGDETIDGTGNNLDNVITGNSASNTLIGGKGNDRLLGGAGDDHLEGGEGDDILTGGADADILEGGSGFDTYLAGDGDTIKDSDGKGRVLFAGTVLSYGYKEDGKNYYEGNGGIYRLSNGTLTFTADGTTVTIKSYSKDQASLGIRLEEEPPDDPQEPQDFASPLVLDLNNNSITSTSVFETEVYFDLDGDGFREHCGWIESGDGLLALDLDGSGAIENGNELFGNYTPDETGANAEHGFAALSRYDENSDGVMNSDDAIFSSLRVWIDANGDGQSQTDELYTLDSLHIQSIDLNSQESDDLEAFNQVNQVSTFTRQQEDESGTLLVDEAGNPITEDVAIRDVWFNRDNENTQYDVTVAPSTEILSLPEMKGSGRAKNLSDAMAEDSQLQTLVEDLIANSQGTVQSLQTLAGNLLARWTHTDDIDPTLARGQQYILNHNYTNPGKNSVFRTYAYARDVAILECFDGEVFRMNVGGEMTDEVIGTEMAKQMADKYSELRDSVIINILSQDLLGNDVYDAETGELDRDVLYSRLATKLNSTVAAEKQEATCLLAVLLDRDRLSLFEYLDSAIVNDTTVSTILAQSGITLSVDSDGEVSGSINGKQYGSSGNDSLSGSGELYGLEGNDTLNGGSGHDTLHGNQGDDILNGGIGDDMLYGDDGNDVLKAGDGYGHDILIGGRGDDTLYGNGRSSTFIYHYGDGNDVIIDTGTVGTSPDILDLRGILREDVTAIKEGNDLLLTIRDIASSDSEAVSGSILIKNAFSSGEIEQFEFEDQTLDFRQLLEGSTIYDDTYQQDSDTPQFSIQDCGGTDTLIFAEGVTPEDLIVRLVDENTIAIGVAEDGVDFDQLQNKITIINGMQAASQVENYQFADGTIFNLSDLLALQQGTEGDDILRFLDGSHAVQAAGGNDTIITVTGDDQLSGGTGNDVLQGGAGNDTYCFSRGDGHDQIKDSDGSVDSILFGEDISVNDLIVEKDGDSIIIEIKEGDILLADLADTIVIHDWYAQQTRIEQLSFSDGSSLNTSEILSLMGSTGVVYGLETDDVITGGSEDDIVFGQLGNDTIHGLGGADQLYGEDGDDTLEGGTGNDVLYGGSGNDTYVFNRNDGQDVLDDYSTGTNGTADTLHFGVGIIHEDLIVLQEGNHLKIGLKETNTAFEDLHDQILIRDWFSEESRIEQFTFSDDVTLTAGAILQFIGTDASDVVLGFASDSIFTDSQGDDTFEGQGGNDVYRFGTGGGNDIISDSNGLDRLIFSANVDPEDVQVAWKQGTNTIVLSYGNDGEHSITLTDWYIEGNRIEQIEFQDGTIWTPTDVIERMGTEGDDVYNGLSGVANEIHSGAGDDIVSTFAENDSLYGGAGNDALDSREGNDILAGEGGDDLLWGGSGDDTYIFNRGDGHDTILDDDVTVADAGYDRIQFGAGIGKEDLIFKVSNENDDLLIMVVDPAAPSTSQDELTDRITLSNWYSAKNRIELLEFLGSGEQMSVADILLSMGTEGNDEIKALVEGSVLNGLAGDDQIFGNTGNDILIGGAGNDTIDGGSGNDSLIGGTGSDMITGGAGNDTYSWQRGDGIDTIYDLATQTYYQYGYIETEDGYLRWGRKELQRAVDGGDDTILLGESIEVADIQVKRIGDDAILGLKEDGKLFAELSDKLTIKDYFNANNEIETIQFADGTLWNAATMREMAVLGTAEADTLVGFAQDDLMQGYAGDDTLSGVGGNDVLTGGTGNDTLDGGAGSDTYCFALGDGQDVINNYDTSANRHDVIEFVGGITESDVRVQRNENNLVLSVGQSGDQIVVTDFFIADGAGYYAVDEIRFENGTSWNIEKVKDLSLLGTDGADLLDGFSRDDLLVGYGGADTLNGYAGNDTLQGGTGNDILDGGTGSDTYLFASGDGQDIIRNHDLSSERYDVIEFASDISSEDVLVKRSGDDLCLLVGNGEDQVLVENFFINEATGGYAIDAVRFASGLSWSSEDLKDLALLGTDSDDYLLGYSTDDLMNGYGGDDTLQGMDGNDTIFAGAGNDTVLGGDGDDLISGESGNDNLSGEYGNDEIHGGLGNDIIYGNDDADMLFGDDGDDFLYGNDGEDHLFGGAGNDVLDANDNLFNLDSNFFTGGTGNDTIYGSYGSDTYFFNLGDGQDTIHETPADEAYSNIECLDDKIVFGTGIGPDDLSFARIGYDMVISLANGTDSLTITNWFLSSEALYKIDEIEFSEEIFWDYDTIEAHTVYYGTGADDVMWGYRDNDDVIYAGAGNDYLEGKTGDDSLYGEDGDDQLNGGSGDNFLRGGLGNDTYVYRSDAGVYQIDNSDGGSDWLLFTDDLTADRLSFIKSGDDLIVRVDGDENHQVVVGNWFLGEQYQLYAIQPSGANGITAATINRMFPPDNPEADGIEIPAEVVFDQQLYGTSDGEQLLGTSGNDSLRGYEGNDYLFGQGGDDWLLGGSGDDQLDGGTGNDMLYGGSGNDVYVFRSGYGAETIDNSGGGTDWLLFDTGLTLDTLVFSRVDDNLVIDVDGTDDQVTVLNWFTDTDNRIEYIQPYGGNGISAAQIETLLTEDPPAGDFDTVVEGTTAAEQLVGTSGADQLNAYAGDDQLFGLAGDDELNGGDGNDYLDGGAGNDVQNGGAGADQLGGDAGDDILVGGSDNDIYVYRAGAGADTIINTGGGTDWLIFDDGITSDRLSFIQSEDDLIIRVDENSATQVTVSNWFQGGENQLSYIQPDGESGISAAQINALFTVPPDDGGDEDLLTVPDENTFDMVVTGAATGSQIVGSSGNDLLQGLAGDDQLFGLGGNDWLVAGDGSDYLDGGSGNDTQLGGAGDDQLGGDAGDDVLSGGSGNDIYVYRAGSGNDTIINEGGGTDWLIFTDAITADRLTYVQTGDDLLVNIDDGEAGSVTVLDWFLDSEHQLSYIQPSGGYGIPAASLPIEQASTTSSSESGSVLVLSDFVSGEDVLELSKSVFTSLTDEGTLSSALFCANSTGSAQDDNDYILYNTSSGALLYDADGNGEGAAVQFASLSNKPEISANDFLVVA